MLRRLRQDPEAPEDNALVTGRALLIFVASAGISLVTGGSAATVGWFGAISLADPTAGILTAAAAGLSTATLTFVKAVDLLHRLIE